MTEEENIYGEDRHQRLRQSRRHSQNENGRHLEPRRTEISYCSLKFE